MNEQEAVYLSEDGLRKLQEELGLLKSEHRREIAARLEYAKSLGDLSENAEYQEAKEEQFSNERRIAEIEDLLRRSRTLPRPGKIRTNVAVGATVLMAKEGGTEECWYHVVSSEEASPAEHKISMQSPLGQAVLGKKKGETVMVFTPRGPMKYRIIDIS
ncbi:MAG: transcription elongation factor GreA [Parcubacteria group bacterium]|nr:transcription elongation factor GreA [Parcubacteria group bacterium]